MSIGPFVPVPQGTAIVNPEAGGSGAPPLPHISNAQFQFAPTAVSGTSLIKGGTPQQNAQALADTILQASRWADDICFGQDPSDTGASLAASLAVESATIRIKKGELRLLSNYRPLVQLVGVAVGSGMSTLANIDSSLFAMARPGRRTWTIPFAGPNMLFRSGDSAVSTPYSGAAGAVYCVWSNVTGFPHTKLLDAVAANATTCVVASTDGNGGLWGVFPASGGFPGSRLRIVDQGNTESIFVQSIAVNTPSAGQTTLTTSAFVYAHTIPTAPDFIPVTAIPETIGRAVISLAACLIKLQGSRAMVMSSTVGGKPSKQALAQAGAMEDFEIAEQILNDAGVIVRVKRPGSY